jgi:hypothetical protein
VRIVSQIYIPSYPKETTIEVLRWGRGMRRRSAIMKLTAILVLASLLGFLLPLGLINAKAATPLFSTPINLSNDQASAQDPNVQNVGNHVYVTWTERTGGIKFRERPDGGVTWSPALNRPALRISNSGGTTQYPLMSANGSNV